MTTIEAKLLSDIRNHPERWDVGVSGNGNHQLVDYARQIEIEVDVEKRWFRKKTVRAAINDLETSAEFAAAVLPLVQARWDDVRRSNAASAKLAWETHLNSVL